MGLGDGCLPVTVVVDDPVRLADAIVALGYATRDRLADLAAPGRRTSAAAGAVLVEAGVLSGEQLAHALATAAGLEYVDLHQTPLDVGAASLIGRTAAAQYEALPIGYTDDGRLRVAVIDPSNAIALGEIGLVAGRSVAPVVVSREGLERTIARLDELDAGITDEPEPEPEPDDDLRSSGDDAPVVRLVHSVIADAMERRASDIHFELEGGELRVKFRIDGLLVRATTVPAAMAPGVVSRIKVMAELDIAERRVPQDGRIRLRLPGRHADLRVVTVPVVGGEAVVLRILDGQRRPAGLAELGLRGTAGERLETALAATHGAVLVTGPTGSGKTTTLYAALQRLNGGERAIITVEDPVEYEISNAKQVQVNAKAGVTFATALRTLMRADPDIVMIGEIRDRETARIGVEAALTGHLVLSTLHTNDAPSAVVRLTEMGIEPFLVASALRCVVAQRLLRRLCEDCRRPVLLPADLLERYGLACPDGEAEAWEAGGCVNCGGTGYRGRLAVYEVMAVDPDLRRLVLDGADAGTLGAHAVAHGMTTLRDDAHAKLLAGRTSLEEVLRVLGHHA